jgi:CelD/BcsL family acetyltransferase involved in cellulose biosynthesis
MSSDLPVRAAGTAVLSRLYPESLATEWDELVRRVGATPCLHPGWVAAWWRAFGTGKLEIRTLRRNGRLVAVLPMVRRYGAVKAVANYHTPQSGLLAQDRSAATEIARLLFAEKPRRVSLASLDPMSVNACRRAAEEAGYNVVVLRHERAPYLDIRGDWNEYQSRLSKNLAADLRRSRRRLGRKGEVSVEIANGRGEHLDELLAEAFAVETSGWKDACRTAIRSRPETRSFYTDVARWAAERDMLRVFFLRLDGLPLATYFALEQQGVCHLLKGGYDPAYGRFSPGKLLMRAVVSHCFSAGLSRIEFHGDMEPYKLFWASAVHTRMRFEAFSRSPAGQLAWTALAYGRPAVKTALRRLRSLAASRKITVGGSIRGN